MALLHSQRRNWGGLLFFGIVFLAAFVSHTVDASAIDGIGGRPISGSASETELELDCEEKRGWAYVTEAVIFRDKVSLGFGWQSSYRTGRGPIYAIPLPRRLFQSDADFEAFKALVKTRIPNHHRGFWA